MMGARTRTPRLDERTERHCAAGARWIRRRRRRPAAPCYASSPPSMRPTLFILPLSGFPTDLEMITYLVASFHPPPRLPSRTHTHTHTCTCSQLLHAAATSNQKRLFSILLAIFACVLNNTTVLSKSYIMLYGHELRFLLLEEK